MSRWYTLEAIALELDIPLKTIYFYHKNGSGPQVYKFGKHLRVLEEDFLKWKKDQLLTK
jgi:hypothetical protein